MRAHPAGEIYKKSKACQNGKLQKLIILEGFCQNGLHILIQRIFLRILAPVKIDFRHFFENDIFCNMEIVKNCIKLNPRRL